MINSYTKTPKQHLEVTREGAPDQEYYIKQARAEQLDLLASRLQDAGRALGRPMGNLAYNVRKELKLAVFDALHGTDYRAQWHRKLEQYRRARFESTIGLHTSFN